MSHMDQYLSASEIIDSPFFGGGGVSMHMPVSMYKTKAKLF